jgi:hypothetical protein
MKENTNFDLKLKAMLDGGIMRLYNQSTRV